MTKESAPFIPMDSLQRPDVPGLADDVAAFLKRGGVIQQIANGVTASAFMGHAEAAKNYKASSGMARKPGKASQLTISKKIRFEE